MSAQPAPGDPVRALLRRHSTLCEQAVDPLELAAGLEASGVTDSTAARCRHRDVFSLAEELFARTTPHPLDGFPHGALPDPAHPPGARPRTDGPLRPEDRPGRTTARTSPGKVAAAEHPAGDRPPRPEGHSWAGNRPDRGRAPAAAAGPGAPQGRRAAAPSGDAWASDGQARATRDGRVRASGSGGPPGGGAPRSGREDPGRARPLRGWCAVVLWPLLPGLLCAGTTAWLVLLEGGPGPLRAAVYATGAAAVLGSALVAVRLAVPARRAHGGARMSPVLCLCACWLTGYALYGDWLLEQLLGGGPELTGEAPRPSVARLPLTCALAVAPAVWCVRGFARGARRRLADSRSLEEFAARVRPLLALTVVVFAASLPVLHRVTGAATRLPLPSLPSAPPVPEEPERGAAWAAAALGLLLFAALLLAAHGSGRAARRGLAVACLAEAGALLTVTAARLPGLAALGRPVEALVAHLGPAAVPSLACGVVAPALLAHAGVALARASAHHREAVPG